MFKFDFQIEDIEDETNILSALTPQPQEDKSRFGEHSFDEHLLKDLVRPLLCSTNISRVIFRSS